MKKFLSDDVFGIQVQHLCMFVQTVTALMGGRKFSLSGGKKNKRIVLSTSKPQYIVVQHVIKHNI